MVAIETRYHGPGNVRGSRVSVRRMDDDKRPDRIYVSWDHALNPEENHRAAALVWLRKHDWLDAYGAWIGGHTQHGMVFVNEGRERSEVLR